MATGIQRTRRRLALVEQIHELLGTGARPLAEAVASFLDEAAEPEREGRIARELELLAEVAALSARRRLRMDEHTTDVLVVLGDLGDLDRHPPRVAIRSGSAHTRAAAWRLAQLAFLRERLPSLEDGLRAKQRALRSLVASTEGGAAGGA